jgi:hypothetical protein
LAKTWQKAFDDLRKGWNDPKRELRVFSLDQNVVVSGTKPVLLSVKNELFEIPRQSWRSLYVVFLATFYAYAEYRNAIKSVVSWSSRNDFLREPQKIGRTVFVETNLSALQIFNHIRDVLELCDIPLEKVHIAYFSLKKDDSTSEEGTSRIKKSFLDSTTELEQADDSVAQLEQPTISDTCVQSLGQIGNVTGTKPLNFQFAIENQKYSQSVKSWTSLYIEILLMLIERIPGALKILYNKGIVVDGNKKLRNPHVINRLRDLYVETNLNSNQLFGCIKSAVAFCGVPEQDVSIEYIVTDKIKHERSLVSTSDLKKEETEEDEIIETVVENDSERKHRQKYLFNGAYLGKGPAVWAVVNCYVEQHPEISFEELQKVFPDDAARPGFAKMVRRYEDVDDYDWKGRRFNKDLISLKDGTQIAVSTQWTPANFSNFCKFAQKVGLLIENVESGTDDVPPSRKKNVSNEVLLVPYKKVLVEKFSSGYILNNIIQRNRFRHFYEELNGSTISASDMELDNTIEMCGMVHDGRLYVTECVLEDSKKTEVLEYIENQLNLHPRLYLEKLLEHFAYDFRDTPIEGVDVLRTYLQELPDFNYYINKDRVFRDESYRHIGSPKDEVKRLLEEECRPMSDDEIFKKLDWIPEEKIKVAFMQCSITQEILSNGDHSRFILESFDISGDELEWLSNWIRQELDDAEFMGSMDLVKALKSKYPEFAERNCNFRDIGIRNALALLLQDYFNFNGNLITKKGKTVSNEKLFVDFCKTRESFNVDDVDAFADSLNVPALYDVIYTYSFRLNDRDFIRDVPSMDVDAIDSVIENFLNEENFIPLKKIDFWGNFPITVGRWNHFLLESFLWRCSKKFKLVHSNFSKTTFAGAIVRKDATLNFEDVLVYALSEKDFDAVNAKKFLKDEGFLAREKCSNIDTLLEKARQMRSSRK